MRLVVLGLIGACGFRPGMLALGDDVVDDAALDAPDSEVDDADIDAPIQRVTSGIVAYYTFEEGSGATVVDRSGVGTALDLTIANTSNVTWSSGTLTLAAETLVASPGAATKIIDACKSADALTLEAWITPSAIGGYFPRVVTLSTSNNSLALTLMAIDDHFEFRMRGPMTDNDGLPSLNSPSGTVVVAPIHVVLVSEPDGTRRIYVDGIERVTDARGGDLNAWTTGHRLGLGNEIDGARPWLGTYDLVAIYSRALSATEVTQNFAAGPR